MKKYRKILILLVLLAIVATFTISPTFAATKTVKLDKWTYYYHGHDPILKGTGYMTYSKSLTLGSAKFSLHASATIDLRKRNSQFISSDMSVVSKKKFKSVTFYKINVKTLKVKKKTMKGWCTDKDWGDKNAWYVVTDPVVGKSNYVPYKIVINY